MEYARYARTPYPRTLPTPTPTPSSSPRTAEASHSGNGFVHMSQKDSGLSVVQLGSRRSVLVQRDLSAPVSGEGTGGNPYVYSISDGETVTAAFLEGVKTQAEAEHENHLLPAGCTGQRIRFSGGEPGRDYDLCGNGSGSGSLYAQFQ